MFSQQLLTWFEQHGRKDLPWQQTVDPYRIWVSEIMLQQTQVNTVIPYYTRFMQRFADIASLAGAPLDDVLKHWSGLGYYARARNLHKAAGVMRDQHRGQFPRNFDEVVALPGIGRSTAGAILAFSEAQRHPILDGNVKRVLARYFAVEGWSGHTAVAEQLWQHAEALTPHTHIREYTQAIMDLGATVCTRSKPQCEQCPLQQNCRAYAEQRVAEFPASRPKKAIPVRETVMLMLLNSKGEVLLQRRPPTGIWGGLMSLPEFSSTEHFDAQVTQQIGKIAVKTRWEKLRHTFSHFHLDIQPVLASLVEWRPGVADQTEWQWQAVASPQGGIAAPIKILLQRIQQDRETGVSENGSNGTVR